IRPHRKHEMARGDGYDQVLSMWGIQDSLLQAYRSIFITAESIVFAIAAAITTLNPWSAIALTVLGLVLLWMWHKVCSSRAVDVSFVQWLLARAEEGADISAPLTNFKEFQTGKIITIAGRSVWRHVKKDPEGKVNDEPFISITKSPTRRWMEVNLPIVFGLLWLGVACLAVRALCASNAV
ncbi:MAG: hypothetical protein WA635_00305, partial [Gallionella sp.]